MLDFAAHPLPAPATSAGGAQVTRLEQAALRLYAATKADRERSAKMARLVRKGLDVLTGKVGRD